MLRKTVFAILAPVFVLPATAEAQDARSILETAQQRQMERWEGVDAYVVEQTMMNQSVSTWFIRADFTDDNGNPQTIFMPMTETQMQNRQCDVGLSADELDAFAAGAEMTGNAAGAEIERGMDEAGLPKGMLAATGTDPWNTMDPRVMMGGNAEFLRAAAEGKRQDQAYDPSADAKDSYSQMQTFLENAKVLGTESIDGRSAWHIRAEDLNHVQPADDGEYRIEAISMFVDTADYVPLSMKMEGTMVADDQSQPMTMDMIQTDYRQVPGSNMYESYRQVMRMSGMMSPEQEAQLAEAQAQLAEFEKQKASMPPQQVAMMESMMGPQLKMLEDLTKGDGFEFETVINNIRVNPVLTDAMGNACAGTGRNEIVVVERVEAPGSGGDVGVIETPAPEPVSGEFVTGENLVFIAQRDLNTLGYDTGGTTGEMNTATIVAISKFQAENNMEVTGEVTPQLAGILSARASGGAAAPAPDPEELRAAQQACLQGKMEAAQAAQKKKRGFGRLLSGVSRLAGQAGNFDMMRTTNDIYQAGATADDISQAAKDLGLTEDDIEACQNPM